MKTAKKDYGLLAMVVCSAIVIVMLTGLTVWDTIKGNYLMVCVNLLMITASAINFFLVVREYRTGKRTPVVWAARVYYLMTCGIIISIIGLYTPLQ